MEDQFRSNDSTQQDQFVTTVDTSSLLEQRDSPIVRIRKQVDQIRGNFMLLLSPGDKQFKDLSKRVRLMLISFMVPVLFGVAKFATPTALDVPVWWLIVSIVLGAITYGSVYWGVKAQVRKEALYSVMTIPSLFVISYSMFLFALFVGSINRLYLWALFIVANATYMVLLYIITLAINILNVTLFYTIPLSRLGESVAYIVGVITVFFAVYVTSSVGMNYLLAGKIIPTLLVVAVCYLLIAGITRYLWLYFIPYQRGVYSFVFATAAFLTLVAVGFSITLPAVWQVSACVSGIAYVLYGQVIHKEQNTLKPMVITEFLLVITILIAFILSI